MAYVLPARIHPILGVTGDATTDVEFRAAGISRELNGHRTGSPQRQRSEFAVQNHHLAGHQKNNLHVPYKTLVGQLLAQAAQGVFFDAEIARITRERV